MRMHVYDFQQLKDTEAIAAAHIHSVLIDSIRWATCGMHGLIVSQPFDIVENPRLLVWSVTDLFSAAPTNIGFPPYLQLTASAGAVGLTGSVIQLVRAVVARY